MIDFMLLAFMSKNSKNGAGNTNINSSLVLDLEHLMLWHDVTYYDSITTAIGDITNNTIGENSSNVDEENKVAVYVDGGIPHVVLLKNCDVTSTINITTDMCIVLNGHKLSSKDITTMNIQCDKVMIDGRVSGSTISVSTDTQANHVSAINLSSGSCHINGGTFDSTTFHAGERNNPHGMIVANSGTNITIDNAKLIAKDESGAINCICMKENSTLVANNCTIEAMSKTGLSPDAIYSYGNIEMSNCNIIGYSNHVANAAGNDYGATSRGVNCPGGSAKFINCHVKGTHSGMTIKGDLYVDGCVFESYSHGGIYIGSTGKTVYLRNSVIQQCEMPNGYIADNVAGTNNAGMYVGGASNITIYVDNCKFYGIQQPIVLRGSSGEQNNSLYISNSYINLNYQNYGIRNDGSHMTYFGVGNNFNETNLKYNRNYEITEEDYKDVMPTQI